MAAYFELRDDVYLKDRWYLNRLIDVGGNELDSREFRYGNFIDLGPPLNAKSWKEGTPVAAYQPLKVLLDPKRKGVPLDFTFTNADMPIATSKVATLLAIIASADIQRIPVRVESQEEEYEIINVVSVVDCIDTERSEIQWFKPGNNVRPDLAGTPEWVSRLVIDPGKVCEHNIFRPKGWEVVIAVSDVVKRAFEEEGITGVSFRKVSP